MFKHFTKKDHKNFLQMAYAMREHSHDPRTQTGAVIISPKKELVAMGTNRLPNCMKLTLEFEQLMHTDAKYMWLEHAERDAIQMAARDGKSTKNCVMYVTLFPCADCARAIAGAGIQMLVLDSMPDPTNERWKEKWGAQWMAATAIFKINQIKTLILTK